jgi:hypothetical protein
MTKPQIWIAIFLGIFILLFMIGRLTKDESISSGSPESNPMPQSDFSSEDLSARDLIGRLGLCYLPWTRSAGNSDGTKSA